MIGEKIKELRSANNWTTRELAQKAEITQAMVVNYENGKSEPKQKVLLKLAKAFNIHTDELIAAKSTAHFKFSVDQAEYNERLVLAKSINDPEAQAAISAIIDAYMKINNLKATLNK